MLVHIRNARIDAAKVELLAVGLANENNQKGIQAVFERYLRIQFPGQDREDKDKKAMEAARAALAEEVKKVYVVRRHRGGGKNSLQSAAAMRANPGFAQVAGRGVFEEFKREKDLRDRFARGRKYKLPEGVEVEER